MENKIDRYSRKFYISQKKLLIVYTTYILVFFYIYLPFLGNHTYLLNQSAN